MTRDEFILELRTADGSPEDEPFSRSGQRIADYDADRRMLIKEQRAAIEKLQSQLATAKGEVVWTTQKPTESGWYWMKYGSAMAVVQIDIGTFDGFHIEWVWQAGSRMQTPLSFFKRMQWAGPIHEPKELA